MSGKFSSLRKRLARVEEQVADRARRAELANCICCERTIALTHKAFEAEMNQTCPVHGFRRLGMIHAITFVNPGRTLTEESVKLMQLVETYELRLSQLSRSCVEVDHEPQEP